MEGPSGSARVTAVSVSAPRKGRRVEVLAPASVLENESVWMLARKEPADVVLAVDELPALEARREKLGPMAEHYAIFQVPLVDKLSP